MAQSFYPYRDEIFASGNFVYYGSAVPTNGDFNIGDIMIVVPTAATANPGNAPLAYRCTTASVSHNGGTWAGVASGSFTVTTPVFAAASASTVVFVADASYSIQSVSVIVGTVTAGSGTIWLELDTGTQAPGSGTTIFAANINPVTGNTPANTVTAVPLAVTPTVVAVGNRISYTSTGTLTSLAGVVFVITMTRN